MTTTYSCAVAALVQDVDPANTFNDPGRTPEANGRKGTELAQAAVEKCTAAIPPVPADLDDDRTEFIAAARPTTADQVAVVQLKLDLVKDKLATWQRLGEIVRQATEPTLSALS
ncbi:hypothetical protein [Rathayibacter festucae]|uniref:Uncharacterized protein n=1 Tax=Rathayibacter festucae DSM 15932 TaxID=1328866 RepID=A0A3T0T2H1_9MICO|nr:hypothetical protein [Rathayibacter festucae]AZZ52811.1 hypothetical protein C1I64_12675 [Rathayibacter festucae DSM 15932]